jgi:prepilin-type N-terminal cleavage/methylation domain-containing protein/prepilin-type processing-associated H-X9-DG protein
MTKSSPPLFHRAFTLIEVLVAVAIIAIMMALAIPALTRALERAKATKDLSNLRQIGIAMQTLLNDNDQLLPLTTTWPGISTSTTPVLYPKYLSGRRVLQSPFDKRASAENDSAPVSYSINANMYIKLGTNPNMLKVVSPTYTFLMAPKYTGAATTWTGTATSAPDLPVGAPAETTGTHSNGRQINVLFCDWHTETLTFGPGTTSGTFQDWQSVPLGVKHWDPTQ